MSSSESISSISSSQESLDVSVKRTATNEKGDVSSRDEVQYAIDRVNIKFQQSYKSLTIFAQEVLKKLEVIIGDKIPGGIASLTPEEHTPEKTAQRIVDGVTGLFGVYAKQNTKLEGEALISGFMKTIRGGVQTGYSDASRILGDIGAFEIGGVKEGIEKTMQLVEEKLKAFEDNYRKTNGITSTEATTEAPAANASI